MDSIRNLSIRDVRWGRLLIVGLLILFPVLLYVLPWGMFWAVEVLTGHHIPYTWRTWCAAIILLGLFGGRSGGGSRG